METSTKPAGPPVDKAGSGDDLYNFTLAERYALLTEAELEQRIDQEADIEVSSSAYEGVPLDKEEVKNVLRRTYQRLRTGVAI